MHNLAGNPEYAKVMQELRGRLNNWRRQQEEPLPAQAPQNN
jgi:hypothetical protein